MDLIDRSEILYKFAEILPEADSLEWYEQAKPEEVKDLVDELYSIVLSVNRKDAQFVKHGHWVEVRKHRDADGCILTDYKCSECGIMLRDTNPDDRDNEFYCYHCGAKMGGYMTCPHISEEDMGLVKNDIESNTGRCETCKRNADNGGVYDDGRTRCPIQEHYALLKDGYCHLYEKRMRGENDA